MFQALPIFFNLVSDQISHEIRAEHAFKQIVNYVVRGSNIKISNWMDFCSVVQKG